MWIDYRWWWSFSRKTCTGLSWNLPRLFFIMLCIPCTNFRKKKLMVFKISLNQILHFWQLWMNKNQYAQKNVKNHSPKLNMLHVLMQKCKDAAEIHYRMFRVGVSLIWCINRNCCFAWSTCSTSHSRYIYQKFGWKASPSWWQKVR